MLIGGTGPGATEERYGSENRSCFSDLDRIIHLTAKKLSLLTSCLWSLHDLS